MYVWNKKDHCVKKKELKISREHDAVEYIYVVATTIIIRRLETH
jgi:hypothetical protein